MRRFVLCLILLCPILSVHAQHVRSQWDKYTGCTVIISLFFEHYTDERFSEMSAKLPNDYGADVIAQNYGGVWKKVKADTTNSFDRDMMGNIWDLFPNGKTGDVYSILAKQGGTVVYWYLAYVKNGRDGDVHYILRQYNRVY